MNTLARKPLRLLLGLVVLAFLTVLLGIVPIGAGFLKGTIEEAVRDATGLELSIEGPLELRLGPRPAVWSGGISVGDPAADALLEVDSVQATASMLSLLRGRIHVRDLRIDGIQLDYCAPLPDFPDGPATDSEPPPVGVDAIALSELSIRCGPATQDDPLALDVASVSASAPLDTPMQLNAVGRLSTLDIELTVAGGTLNELLRETRFPLSAKLAGAGASLEANGHLQILSGEPSAEATLEATAKSLRPLASTFDVELPELGKLDAQGRLRIDRERIDIQNLAVDLGNSDVDIDAVVDLADERAMVTMTATSGQLDVGVFLSNDPAAQASGPAATDTEIDLSAALEALSILDANVDASIGELLGLPVSAESIQLSAALMGGRVELRSMTAELLGGNWSVSGTLDSRPACPEVELIVNGSDLDLATLNPLLALDQALGGSASEAHLEAFSCGSTLSTHLDTLRADATIADIRASLDEEILPLGVSKLATSLAPDERTRGRLVGTLNGASLEATLVAGSLQALLSDDTWPLNVDIRGGGGQLRIDGRARVAPQQTLIDARARFDAPALGTLHAWTGGAADAALPVHVTTRLRLDDADVVADDLSIVLGQSDAGGRVAWNYAQGPDLLSITLRSDSVDIPEIVKIFPPATGQADSVSTLSADDEAPMDSTPPSVDLDLTVGEIHANQLDIQHFRVNGRLREGFIDAARVSLVVEDEVQLEGRLDLDVRQPVAQGQFEFAANNLDIGRVLRRMQVVDNLQLRADALELQVNMQGATPREFVLGTLLHADLRNFRWQIPKLGSDDRPVAEQHFEISLEQVELMTSPRQATTWSARGQADGVDVELFVRAPSLQDIAGNLEALPITLVATAGNDVAMVDTRLDLATEDALTAQISISGQIMPGDHRDLAALTAPLEDYQLRSDVNLVADHLQLTNLRMNLGNSSAEGRAEIDASGSRNSVDVSLHAPYLQTDDLLYWSRDFGRAERDGDAGEVDTDNGPTERRGVLSLANEFLAEFRQTSDLDVRITVDELRAGSGLLGGGEIQLHVDATEFSLSPVQLSLPGGGIDAEYRATVDGGRLDAILSIRADALSYGGLLRLADDESDARGLLYLDANISANVDLPPGGIPLKLLLENAQGEIALAAWPENFEAGILDLWSANIVLALLPTPEEGRQSRLNCMVTRFDIEDGLMKSSATLLDTTDTIIRGRGKIDLKNEQLDLLVWPQAKREKFLSVSTPVAVTGSFDDFRIGVEPGGFIGTAIKWYTSLIYVPFKWLTGERFPPDGTATCFDAMDWDLTPGLQEYFLQRDFSAPPAVE